MADPNDPNDVVLSQVPGEGGAGSISAVQPLPDDSNPNGQPQTDPITGVNFNGQSIYDINQNMVNNPSLPVGTKVNPVLQTTNPDELLKNTTNQNVNTATNSTVNSNPNTTASKVNTAQLQSQEADTMSKATYDPTAQALSQTETVLGAHGSVSALSTVQAQLGQLMDFDPNTAPAWAKGASAMANDQLAARGMGASSIAGATITQAIMQAGLPIATADAETYAKMDLANLNDDQQAVMQTAQNRQQSMLSDQAAINAAKQFNAQNQTQVAEFFSNLMSATDQFNVNQANAMQQQSNQLHSNEATTNATLATQVSQYNATAANDMQKFYDSNQLIVDQSNASWRRNVNTANTTAINTANQLNAANLLSISTTAQNNLWQAARDNASWVHTDSESAKDRAANMAIAVFNQQSFVSNMNTEQQNAFFASLGSFGLDLFKGLVSKP